MEIQALAYIGLRSRRMEEWRAFATGLLGMQTVDRTKAQSTFRMDDRRQRLFVEDEAGDDLATMGWEVGHPDHLGQLASRLDRHGIAVRQGSRALADQRRVADLIHFDDSSGNRLEICWKPEVSAEPFVPGRPISGFKTGALGMGHVVLHVIDAATLLPFYRDLLGFRVSDYALAPYPLYFLHVNGRHHSFAMVGSGQRGIHHFMVELCSLDDVGQGYDLAQQDDDRIAFTLGRHSNDFMTSFYANSPSGFFIEYGWGGRVIEPETWKAHETCDGPSFWGHERLYLPEAPRARLRQMRLDAAAKGLRVPAEFDCPWLAASLRATSAGIAASKSAAGLHAGPPACEIG